MAFNVLIILMKKELALIVVCGLERKKQPCFTSHLAKAYERKWDPIITSCTRDVYVIGP